VECGEDIHLGPTARQSVGSRGIRQFGCNRIDGVQPQCIQVSDHIDTSDTKCGCFSAFQEKRAHRVAICCKFHGSIDDQALSPCKTTPTTSYNDWLLNHEEHHLYKADTVECSGSSRSYFTSETQIRVAKSHTSLPHIRDRYLGSSLANAKFCWFSLQSWQSIALN
jgi:hypothetical protein